MKRDFLKLIALVLTLALFFTGCGYQIGQSEVTQDGDTSGTEDKEDDGPKSVTAMDGEITNPEDDVFTICWQKDRTLNPYEEITAENAAIADLVYEGLFTVTPDFTAEPCICSRYAVTETEYTFYLRDDITFHDGVKVTATDAVYSLELARAGERFGPRLGCIESVEYVSDLCLRITLKSENRTLPLLLDIPIVEYGTGDDVSPTGTGPYSLKYSENCLAAYSDYRNDTPIDVIYLYDISDETPASAMAERKVDLILYDTSAGTLDVYTDHEIHYFESSILQFIGFNMRNSILGYSDVRRAMGHVVNRDTVLEDFPSGSAASSPLILSPASPGYDNSLEDEAAYDLMEFTSILNDYGVRDGNGDGWLEFNGATMGFDFIVCRDAANNLSAARELTSAMRNVGIRINLRELGYEDYMAALESGNFDMYYAEVRLPANFDLSEILGSEGSLNYGRYSGYDEAINAWLTAETDEEKAEASAALCELVCEKAPVIPVCYRRNALSIPRGRITGLEPGQQNLFRGLSSWKINLDQED